MDIPAQEERACPFVLFQLSTGWMRPTHVGEVAPSLLSLPTQMPSSFGSTLPDTWKDNVLLALWAFLSQVKWTHKINHHSPLIVYN